MKLLKDEIFESILSVARQEFLSKGYKNASMRDIANKANVGLSNVYNYFQNKDEIYRAIMKPAKNSIFTFITQQHTEDFFDFSHIAPYGHNENAIAYYIDLIEKYKEEYRLLLYCSEGSSMANFRNELADHITHISHDYMALEKKHNSQARTVSPFFIHTISSWMVSILGEIVMHDMDRQKIRDFFYEYFRFSFAGWRELKGT
ncbi:AcrR family transcriptional regulator [Dysgonomonadaceae bacterium PH5-43]|nr:AcrR family transcriptional regulator [Dysgonomonadaceae bacterium PH5-43]